mmetsp:Transcript_20526/g.35274  ORF Transcript_20526/g.35274 Transcript_20526/m.35274 type:complete len:290 (-) Transcript_20526:885-1754(-)|eukprot:CAMPEP_0196655098 /NCGR_PEP_ID=MMETSP1086-20130531/4854_1 /TAXON_ID=77921 /ORGANISM="Cyanoptyche  gloeocystis , Strain SAG4.97" /LENGTH=289 /DNA_ID=CAMNT_0041987229 /DNA_START=136 /DNA_END=1005 /DNA_ORIENTATION=-
MDLSSFVQNSPFNATRISLQETAFFGSSHNYRASFCLIQRADARKVINRRFSVQNAFRDVQERPDGEIPARLPSSAPSSKAVVAKLFVCTEKDCCKKGAQNLLAALSEAATPDIQVRGCGCLGKCSKAPVVRVVAGKDSAQKRLFTKVSSKSVSEFLATVKEMALPRNSQDSADISSSQVFGMSTMSTVVPVEIVPSVNRVPPSTRSSALQTIVVKSTDRNLKRRSHPSACVLPCDQNEICRGWGLNGCPCGMQWKEIPVLDEVPTSDTRVAGSLIGDHAPVRLMLFDE